MKSPLRTAVLLLALVLAAMPLAAQTTGSLTGNVTTDDAPLPGVTVTISSASLQGTRVAYTDVNGNYNFGALPPGRYQVEFEIAGLETVSRTVNVSAATTARANAEMQLSAVAEAITITAEAPAVVETTEVQSIVQSDLVEELPVNRTLVSTVNLAPGVNLNGPNNSVVISGGQSFDSVFYVDGAVVNEVLRGQPLDVYIEDALEETTVLTGGISAEYGRFTGGVVTAVSKSGGNEFSGSLRDSLTNPSWTSQTPLDEPEGDDEILEVYEATFGGRIVRDRLWFFTAGRFFETETPLFFANSTIPFTYGRTQSRIEGKLTGQINPRHSVVGSFLDLSDEEINHCAFGCWEPSTLDESREVPQQKLAFTYNGVMTNNFLVEALYSESNLRFIDSGSTITDFATGTPIYDFFGGVFLGAPVFGSALGDKVRDSENAILKGTYYLSTPSIGSHNIVVGYDEFTNSILENNSQSGSDYMIYTFTEPDRLADGTVHPNFTAGDYIIYWPILQQSRGNEFITRSVYLNDKWDLSSKWNFNLGVRYDQNEGVDQAGAKVADDSNLTPRIGATYDAFGNGRFRVNATYGGYASKIANGNVGDAASPAGSPSLLYWYYGGPDISGLPTSTALAEMWAWFQSQGGADNRGSIFTGEGWLIGGGTAGIQSQIRNQLESPTMNEFTIGVSSTLGRRGYLRVDYQNREWENFYGVVQTLDTGRAFDPLRGEEVAVSLTENVDGFTRDYDAILLQAGLQITPRLGFGGNYTWSELTGNVVGETAGSGPIATTSPLYQPELLSYERRNPTGPLPSDQTHKLRAWVTWDQPTPFGDFNLSLLQRFDSGTPYSAIGLIDVHQTEVCPQCPANPGYRPASTDNPYYFSERGEFRWDDVSATDLAINYNLPIVVVQLFVQAEVLNVWDESAQISGDTTVRTANNSTCLQSANGPEPGAPCLAFNPFTETPVEGIHFQYGPRFGEARNPTNLLTQGDYQLPRTYRVSLGLRF
ncbi:MAG TPA: TonB-dependent receptor [Thermoanaerobaculia bacterium]|nr:TonB-dependent receptor [Thermoanaerobaculia bacterium]